MKRLAFFTIALIVIISATGCRRGLRLWGCRGAPCAPAVQTAPPVYQPPIYAVPAPQCVCPPVCPAPAYTQSFNPADPCPTPGTEIPVSDTGFQLQPGEYLVPGAGNPANVAPHLPAGISAGQ